MERDHDRKHARNHDSMVCHEYEKWIRIIALFRCNIWWLLQHSHSTLHNWD